MEVVYFKCLLLSALQMTSGLRINDDDDNDDNDDAAARLIHSCVLSAEALLKMQN